MEQDDLVDEMVVAYHEAGHAVLAESLGGQVIGVTIVPVDDEGPRRHGETKVAWAQTGSDQQFALAQARVALAGPAAEMIYCDEQYEIAIIKEWWADWLVASESVLSVKPNLSKQELIGTLSRLLDEMVEVVSNDHVWHRIATFADELAAHETLDYQHLDAMREDGIL